MGQAGKGRENPYGNEGVGVDNVINATGQILQNLMCEMRQDGLITKHSVRQLGAYFGFSHTQIYNMINDDSLTVGFLRELKKKYGKFKISFVYIKNNVIYKGV